MRKVLVTGATGFIGNYVIAELLRRGFEVIATSLSEEKARSQDWYGSVTYIPFDFKTFDSRKDYYSFFGRPDKMMHLAWEGLPHYKSDFHVTENLPRHFALLKSLLENGLTDISVAGTCLEYGMQEGELTEDLAPRPTNPYAIAKNELRLSLEKLNQEHPFNLKWIRLFYMYGRGQHPHSLFSQLNLAIEKGDSVFKMSPGDQLRDYLPVATAARYMVDIAMQDQVTGIVNCCSGQPIQVKEIVAEYIRQKNATITPELGFYPYSDIEPRNFWGNTVKLERVINGFS